MSNRGFFRLIGAAALCIGLAACGSSGSSSGGSGGNPDPVVPVPSPSTVVGEGIVRQYSGSGATLTVGTKQFDVSDADLRVTIDDEPAGLSDLRVGQRIRYQGTSSDNGTTLALTAIHIDNLVEGPIEANSIDLDAGTMQVLGQVVQVDKLTVFASNIVPNELAGLKEGDFIEVSGLRNASGNVTAGRIELDNASDDFEVRGAIGDVDDVNKTFNIGTLTVDYANATLENFSAAPAAGDWVEVEGSVYSAGVLMAEQVELESNRSFESVEGDLAIVEGEITSITSNTEFSVASRMVLTDAATEYEEGMASDVVVGAYVEVEGRLDAEGVLVATEVEFLTDQVTAAYSLTGAVESVDPAARSLVIMGVTVMVIPTTRMEGTNNAPLDFADIATGQMIEVEGFSSVDAEGALVAAKVEITTDTDYEVTGPATAISNPMLRILEVAVTTDVTTDFEGPGVSDQVTFFLSVGEGDIVEAQGEWNGSTLVVREIELKGGSN